MFYLCDSGVEIDGVKFWGSPVSPRFFDLAFNRSRGTKIRKHWQLIPPDTDVLITHTPPFGILDQNERGSHTGCEDLLEVVLRIKPRYHLFGHIHEAYGTQATAHTTFINGSIVDATDKIANKPIIIEYEK
jgi:Icc-related predicted phosphoesterase